MANNSPKAKVIKRFTDLFGAANVEARGTRVGGRFGGYFLAELNVDGHTVARVRHPDWRKAYKLLTLEVEKLYADCKYNP